MITIVDYGVGNVQAFANYYRRAGIAAATATTAQDLWAATHVVLPGVGSFDQAMRQLNRSGMRGVLEDRVRGQGAHLLGVCVGMQMLAAGSEEGEEPGLGWIPGRVKRLSPPDAGAAPSLPLPHMGWNAVQPRPEEPLFTGLDGEWRFYFLHSYWLDCAEPSLIAATTWYGTDFCCAVRSGNIHGVQFHPEKSHHWGAAILSNFSRL